MKSTTLLPLFALGALSQNFSGQPACAVRPPNTPSSPPHLTPMSPDPVPRLGHLRRRLRPVRRRLPMRPHASRHRRRRRLVPPRGLHQPARPGRRAERGRRSVRCLLRLGHRHGLGVGHDERGLERYVDYGGDVGGGDDDGDVGGGDDDEARGDDDQGCCWVDGGCDDDQGGGDVECGGGEGGGDGGRGGGFGGCCCSLRRLSTGECVWEKYLLSSG